MKYYARMNQRRKLLLALGAGALAVPFGSLAQQAPKVWRIGILAQGARPASPGGDSFGPFLRGMRELGCLDRNEGRDDPGAHAGCANSLSFARDRGPVY